MHELIMEEPMIGITVQRAEIHVVAVPLEFRFETSFGRQRQCPPASNTSGAIGWPRR